MRIPIKGNPIERISCYIENKYEEYTQKEWLRKPHKVKCCICGKELHSMNADYTIKDEYSPEQSGWVQIRYNKIDRYSQWMCHSCHGHHNEHYISKEELEDKYISKAEHKIAKSSSYDKGYKKGIDVGIEYGKKLIQEVKYQPGDIVLIKSNIYEIELNSDGNTFLINNSTNAGYDRFKGLENKIINDQTAYHLGYIKNEIKGSNEYFAYNNISSTGMGWQHISSQDIICKVGEFDLDSFKELRANS